MSPCESSIDCCVVAQPVAFCIIACSVNLLSFSPSLSRDPLLFLATLTARSVAVSMSLVSGPVSSAVAADFMPPPMLDFDIAASLGSAGAFFATGLLVGSGACFSVSVPRQHPIVTQVEAPPLPGTATVAVSARMIESRTRTGGHRARVTSARCLSCRASWLLYKVGGETGVRRRRWSARPTARGARHSPQRTRPAGVRGSKATRQLQHRGRHEWPRPQCQAHEAAS